MENTSVEQNKLKALICWRDELTPPDDEISELLDGDYIHRHTLALVYHRKDFRITHASYESIKKAFQYAKYHLKEEDFENQMDDILRDAIKDAMGFIYNALLSYLANEMKCLDM